MRIAHVTSYQVPGYGYEEIYLARAQVEAGHEVAIFTSNYLHPKGQYAVLANRFRDRQVVPREEVEAGVRISRLPAFEVGHRVWIRGLIGALTHFRPDVVHAHNVLQFHPARLAAMKARGHGVPKLVVDDHMHYSVMRGGLIGRAAYFAYRHLLQPPVQSQVDAFCAISEETSRYLAAECGVRGPIHLMPLGVDTDLFHANAEARQEQRRRLGIHTTATVAVYTGKLIEPKRPLVLVRAALKAIASGHDLHVLLVGDSNPAYLSLIEHAIAEGGQQRRFHFMGSLRHDELPAVYAAADVGVWPRQESMAILEAMSCNLPVIVAADSGYAARVETGAGLTYRAGDATDLAVALGALGSQETRQAMGAIGRQLVTEHLSWQRSAERYLDLYASLVHRTGGGQALASRLGSDR